MKICYISHPIGGDVANNLKDIQRIVRKINLTMPDFVPFVPYYCDCVCMNDDVPEERNRSMKNDFAILESGIVKEIWLTGNIVSTGMKQEVAVAVKLGITVVNFINYL